MPISGDGTTRRAVLDLLKRRGPTDAAGLASALGVSAVAVRRHLDALEADDLIVAEQQRRPVGRPAAVYRLTGAGDETFPRGYPELTDTLLAAVGAEFGPEAAQRVFERRGEQLAHRISADVADRPFADAVRMLATAQDDAGYLAEASPLDDDTALLVEHNCAIARIARDWPIACAAELATFRQVLGADVSVERVQHIGSGDRTCTYLLRRA